MSNKILKFCLCIALYTASFYTYGLEQGKSPDTLKRITLESIAHKVAKILKDPNVTEPWNHKYVQQLAILDQLELPKNTNENFEGTVITSIIQQPEILYRLKNDTIKKKETNKHIDLIISVAITPDGTKIVSGSTEGKVEIWDINTGAHLNTLKSRHWGIINSVAISSDGTTIISGAEDHDIKIWDATTGACLNTLQGHIKPVKSVALSPDGTTIISGAEDHEIKIWDMETGNCIRTFRDHTEIINSVAVSPDGTTIVSGSSDCTVKVWDINTGICLNTLEKHIDKVNSVAISSDGTTIVSGSDDHLIIIWETKTGACLHILKGHTDRINSVVISNNGSKIISGSYDDTIKIWDIENGSLCNTLIGKAYSHGISSVAIAPNGTKIISSSFDRYMDIWDLSSTIEKLIEKETTLAHQLKAIFDSTNSLTSSPEHTKQSSQCTANEDYLSLLNSVGVSKSSDLPFWVTHTIPLLASCAFSIATVKLSHKGQSLNTLCKYMSTAGAILSIGSMFVRRFQKNNISQTINEIPWKACTCRKHRNTTYASDGKDLIANYKKIMLKKKYEDDQTLKTISTAIRWTTIATVALSLGVIRYSDYKLLLKPCATLRQL